MPAVPTARESPRSRSAIAARIALSANTSSPVIASAAAAKPRQVRLVGVGLAEADQPGVGVELDDRAQRVRLVHADGVQQRRVDERDRGDAGAGDANLARRHRYRASVSASASTRPSGGDDRTQFGEVVGARHDQRRPHRPGRDALQRDAGLDERDGVAGHGVAQPDERVEELPQQRIGQGVVAGFDGVVEGEREIRGEREHGRGVQGHADRAVGLLRYFCGRHAVEEQEVLGIVRRGVGDRADDARDIVQIAGAVLEADDGRDLATRRSRTPR